MCRKKRLQSDEWSKARERFAGDFLDAIHREISATNMSHSEQRVYITLQRSLIRRANEHHLRARKLKANINLRSSRRKFKHTCTCTPARFLDVVIMRQNTIRYTVRPYTIMRTLYRTLKHVHLDVHGWKQTRKPSWRKGYARQRRHSKMAVNRHLGFYRNGNSAIRSADPENPNLKPNMEWIGCTVCEIFAFKLYCELETGVRGHLRSSKAALFDRAHTTLYPSSIVTMPLSITVSEI